MGGVAGRKAEPSRNRKEEVGFGSASVEAIRETHARTHDGETAGKEQDVFFTAMVRQAI